jgi:NADPH-dependent 2,4-dienoyl-CoA reductase/sulfur reductase-like enzyme
VREFELVIVGAGAAGLSTATVAAELGVKVAIFDDNALPGGQYFRQLPTEFRRVGKTVFDKDVDRGRELYKVVQHPNATYFPRTVVWNMPEDGVLAFTGDEQSDQVRAEVIVVAAGAHDRPVPFPGWTLPGVATAGGLQNLIKGQRAIPGRRAVVAGNGPLVLLVAANLARAKVDLVATAEVAPVARRVWRQLPDLAASPQIFWQGIEYATTVLRSGAPQLAGWTVIEARGDRECEEVVLAPIDAAGHVDRRAARAFAADLLVTGFGLLPSTELLRICGVELNWSTLRGGWLPRRSAEFETSRPGVFTVGDGSAIGGVEIALVEGRLMGLVAAQRTGRLSSDEGHRLGRGDTARLSRLERFRTALERLYEPPTTYLDLLTPATIVCRCEEVTAAQLREWQEEGYASVNALKSATRSGMGRCQGRNCLCTLIDMVAQAGEITPDQVELPRARPPARPVLLKNLLSTPVPRVSPPDPSKAHLPRGERVG